MNLVRLEDADAASLSALLARSGFSISLGADAACSRLLRVDGEVRAAAIVARQGEAASLDALIVDAELRGRGIGRSLAQAALAAARTSGAQTARLGCDVPRGLRRALGFQGQPEALDLRKPVTVLRYAEAADAAALASIKNQGIEERCATLDTDLLDETAMRAWLDAHGPRCPVIVAAADEGPLGFGSLNVFNSRFAYRFVADLSVYVDRKARGTGLGRRLVADLLARAPDLGYHKAVLSMFPFNTPARTLYLSLGFRSVGIYREQGMLDGRWVDTEIMEVLFS